MTEIAKAGLGFYWSGQYTLDENDNPVPETDIEKWADWYARANRCVARTNLGTRGYVSTVFLGLDQSFHLIFGDVPNPRPVLWETMIFGGPYDQSQWRYSSRVEAFEGHAQAVKMCEDLPVWKCLLPWTRMKCAKILHCFKKRQIKRENVGT